MKNKKKWLNIVLYFLYYLDINNLEKWFDSIVEKIKKDYLEKEQIEIIEMLEFFREKKDYNFKKLIDLKYSNKEIYTFLMIIYEKLREKR